LITPFVANVEHARFVVSVVVVVVAVTVDVVAVSKFRAKNAKVAGVSLLLQQQLLPLLLLPAIVKGKRTCCNARYEDVAAVTVAVAVVLSLASWPLLL